MILRNRKPGWRGRHQETVVASIGRPFEWGVFDCAMFARDVVKAITLVDLAEGFPPYTSHAEGHLAVRRAGHLDFEGMFSSRLVAIPRPMMAIGDVCSIEFDGQKSMGVFNGPDVYVPAEQGGLALVPSDNILRGYAV